MDGHNLQYVAPMCPRMQGMRSILLILGVVCILGAQPLPESGKRPSRLVIRNAMVIEGNATPAYGPSDLTIEGDTITAITPYRPNAAAAPTGTVVIDARGRYLLPGFINAHGHLQDERAGISQPFEYQLKLWLACGITTIRDLGSDFAKSSVLREKSKKGEIEAPRIFLYQVFNRAPVPNTAEQARARVREIKQAGADGIKFFGMYREVMEAMQQEAHALGLRTAHHAAIAETNAWDDIKFGTTTIEHWYGIPDAALPEGVQDFPPSFNVANEIDRFRYAGRLWREADPVKLAAVLDGMVKAGVAWDPTLNIYEASRDLMRHENQKWFRDYLHPALAKFFSPNPDYHGSYFENWTSTDEAFWKENYRIWMKAVRDFAARGGTVGVGEDAGFIYNIYGFGLLRGLELHQEAGFPPLKVIQHATANNGEILGMENRLGRLRPGYAADVILVNGNPLEDFKVFYPALEGEAADGKRGIEWTIKDGIPYHAPTLAKQVRALVAAAKKK